MLLRSYAVIISVLQTNNDEDCGKSDAKWMGLGKLHYICKKMQLT
jgi:hypothetical protein